MTRKKINITRSLFTLLTLIIFVFGCSKKSSGLGQNDVQPIISEFLSKHVQYSEFTDELSERTLNNLIYSMDPGKYYFYKKDVDELMKHKYKIDDYVNSRNYEFVYHAFALYKKRFQETMDLMEKLLTLKYDFQKDETLLVDREKTEYAVTPEDMKERWRKNIKLQLLNYMSVTKNIEEAKNKLRKKYKISRKRIDELDQDRMLSIFANAFSMALDPHSNYLTPEDHEDFMISTNLKLEGIGVMLRSEDGFVLVESIIPGGAADKLPKNMQLKPNDKIVAVAQAAGEPVDVIDMDLRDVVKKIRGKQGTEVRLTVLRKTDEKGEQRRLIVPIIREVIKLEDKAAKSEIIFIKRGGREVPIGYLKLPSFYLDFDAIQRGDPNSRSSSNDVKNELNVLIKKGVKGLIIDLRGNPGGALDEARDIAGLFIDQGPILQIKGRSRFGRGYAVFDMQDNDPGEYYSGPLVVLVDKFSASASEIFAGAIKDYKRGLILGPTSTFGKGTVQNYMKLDDGKKGAMKVTTAIFYQPGGTSNHLDGIKPDIYIPDISSIWDIGENKLRYPLKWEKIKSAGFRPYRNRVNDKIVKGLSASSSKRIKENSKFTSLIKKIGVLKKKLSNKVISLKEESKLENKELKEMERKMREDKKNKLVDTENDLFLKEALEITADYVQSIK